VKKILAAAVLSGMMFSSTCQADTIVAHKNQNATLRTETRHYYEFKFDTDPKKSGWEFKKDRIYIEEKKDDNKTPQKKGK
jgi:opacity protein-like surface antigen